MSDLWTHEELHAVVEAYVDMLRKEFQGQRFVKKAYYKELAVGFGRTEKSFEYRMQNISYVRTLMGRSWLQGLKPAKNVGAKNAALIESIIEQVEGIKGRSVVFFESQVREEVKKKRLTPPSGNTIPQIVTAEVSQYQRDAKVKAWVLLQANGVCELCGKQAPFLGLDGHPFLEIHHIRQLSDCGSDTIVNAVALCPNCHKELHYGINAHALIEQLYHNLQRLIRE